MSVAFEPYRVKVVEPIPVLTAAERARALARAEWNPFKLSADEVTIDLLTDSGFSASSAEQWAALQRGDETYAGSRSWKRLEAVARDLTGFEHILPAHQGRGAEGVLFSAFDVRGKVVLSNGLFDTTRAHVETAGGTGVDLPSPASRDFGRPAAFKGDIDLAALEARLARARRGEAPPVAAVVITATNNVFGAQPVSVANLRATRALCIEAGVPLILDACRIAENAQLVREREKGQGDRSPRAIAQEMFSLADVFTFSGKKDAFASIGGLLGLRDGALAARCRAVLVLREGFPTYGGLAGRDLEALATGLEEATDEAWLAYRVDSLRRFGRAIADTGAPIIEPPGGHAIYIDARALLPHIPPTKLPGQALACDLYLRGGVRACEVGTLMLGHRGPAPHDLVRLCVPRRVYTESHLAHVVATVRECVAHARSLGGLELVEAGAVLRHLTASLRPESAPASALVAKASVTT